MSSSGSRLFSCSECGNIFRRNSDLNRHRRVHNPDAKKFHCSFPHCKYSALQKSNVKTHYIARHTHLRPHLCRFCTADFSDMSCLIKHEKRTHGFYRKAYKKDRDYSAAALLDIPPSIASSKEVKKEVNLSGIPFLPSLGNSVDATNSSTSSVSPVSPMTSLGPIPDAMSYDWCSLMPEMVMDGFLPSQDPQSHLDAGFSDQGPSLWPKATPQSYFSQLWSSVPPFDVPAWLPPDALESGVSHTF